MAHGLKLSPLPAPTHIQSLNQEDIAQGSPFNIATDLLSFDEGRTQEEGSGRLSYGR